MTQVWQVRSSRDGEEDVRFFESEVEADAFANMAITCGATALISPIPLPKTAREFVRFLEERCAS